MVSANRFVPCETQRHTELQPDCPVLVSYSDISHLPEEARFRSKFWNEDTAKGGN